MAMSSPQPRSIRERLEELFRRLSALPGIPMEPRLTVFTSGCAMLDVRRDGRAFVMAYSPARGFGVDELQTDDGFSNSYRFHFADFEPAAQKLRELAACRPIGQEPALSLLVLQARDVESLRDFYSLLGLSFATEQHGSGPLHYAAKLGNMLLEIYPCRHDQPALPLRVGFRVAALDDTIELLRERGVQIVTEARDSPWGRRAVVEDPEGNRVELMASNGK